MPEPFEGYDEVGHLQDIGPIKAYGGLRGRIESVQLIVPDVIMSTL
jgi:hypothetical protein